MAIPPFPSHDLAKLVLGYLAEEQLMTAYDEFLQASPYLDAMRNEYDRMFMTSLRNILAEYRAIKIYVETCKPVILRKRIIQCTNLLEVFKLLLSIVDINKLHGQEAITDIVSSIEPSISKAEEICNACYSSNQASCVCRHKDQPCDSSEMEAVTLDTSVETTLLSDLPGNIGNDVVSQDPQDLIISKSPDKIDEKQFVQSSNSGTNTELGAVTTLQNSTQDDLVTQQSMLLVKSNAPFTTNYEPTENISNSNVTKRIFIPVKIDKSNILIKKNSNKNLTAGSFQDFVAGVNANKKENVHNLPKYKIITKRPSCASKDITSDGPIINNKSHTKSMKILPPSDKSKQISFLCRVSTQVSSQGCQNEEKVENKSDEQKVKILSDVKVENVYTKVQNKMPQILKTATSTPLMETHSIFINGTPAYSNKLQTAYTKAEIMAMPTIILMKSDTAKAVSSNSKTDLPKDLSNLQSPKDLPNLQSPKDLPNLQSPINTQDAKSANGSSNRSLEPLVIDISPTTKSNQPSTKIIELDADVHEKIGKSGLLKIADTSHASLPKDASNLNQDTVNTPNVLPPTRKSSSTPRRSSHIRVLDFNTPRRILSVSNTGKNSISESNKVPLNTLHEETDSTHEDKSDVLKFNVNDTSKENKTKPRRKRNWDEELRALAVKNNDTQGCEMDINHKKTMIKKKTTDEIDTFSKKPPNKNTKKQKNNKKDNETDSILKSEIRNPKSDLSKQELSNKTKKSRKKKKSIKEGEKIENETLKPTVNIVAAGNLPVTSSLGNKQNQDADAERLESTPDMEKMSLHNVIGGAKLNISDFLETPYKQVLYDIQMETPRFLGPDLPGEPLSDIKIANIPTPRFFDTPKVSQATPSSYSSRPTDYSSGGSYYKPDDHDMIPIEDVLGCAVTLESDTSLKTEQSIEQEKKMTEKVEKPKRPVRNCTKNVSYRNASKEREDDRRVTEDVSVEQGVAGKQIKKSVGSKSTPKSTNLKIKSNTAKKSKNTSHNKKSPLKRNTPKNFMKIKPRKLTPIKIGKEKKRTPNSQNYFSNIQSKKRTSSENTVSPIIVVAPTKSRRKSATPRKLHCTKTFNSESSDNQSSDKSKSDINLSRDDKIICIQESDSENQSLRWSDDGSQDVNTNLIKNAMCSRTEEDDISKIKEYIEKCFTPDVKNGKDREGTLQNDLIKRGFDVETARIIERDLLQTPPQITQSKSTEATVLGNVLNVSNKTETGFSKTNSRANEIEDEMEDDIIELSASECYEGNNNFISYTFDETNFTANDNIPKLKDNYSMDIGNVFDDGTSIRLRVTPLNFLIDLDTEEVVYNSKETENAVNSINNIEKLYTPMKDSRIQCYEIFDSTLTSLDTPLKASPQERTQTTVTEIVLEVENVEVKDKVETRKRKRISSGLEESVTVKKTISETQYLLDSASIQNMDIESVLSKLHGP